MKNQSPLHSVRYFLIVIVLVFLFHSCASENDVIPVATVTDPNSAAAFIQSKLQLYPDNGLDKLIQQYGKPSWENAYLNGFGPQQDFIIPLEQNGKIKTIVQYAYDSANSNELIPELINENTIENSSALDRYKNSFLFYTIHKRKPNIVEESVLKFAQDVIDKKAKILKSEISNYQKNKPPSTKRISSDEIQLRIELNMSNWYLIGIDCDNGFVPVGDEIQNQLNRYIEYLNFVVLDDTYVPESVYVRKDIIYVSMRCSKDLYIEKIDEFMYVYNNILTSIGESYCDKITQRNNFLGYLYFVNEGSCYTANPRSDSSYYPIDGGYVDDFQIFNFLTGRSDCLYQKLSVNSQNFKDMIQKFDGTFPVSHLTFSVNNTLEDNVYGKTNLPDDYNISIEMSNTQLAKISDLGGAVAIAHEIIHAEIFRKLLSAAQVGTLTPDASNMTIAQQINYVNSLKNNFPGLYDYYYERYHSTWNHDMMAQHYRSVIADIVQQFDNNSNSRQFYEDLAWAGLTKLDVNTNSIAWNNLATSEQQRILQNLANNFYNGPSNCN